MIAFKWLFLSVRCASLNALLTPQTQTPLLHFSRFLFSVNICSSCSCLQLQHVWHFDGSAATPECEDNAALHFPLFKQPVASFPKGSFLSWKESFHKKNVFKRPSWVAVHFTLATCEIPQGIFLFFDLHYYSGGVTRLHMSLINLIPSGNSLDIWACCRRPTTLLFTFSTAGLSQSRRLFVKMI